MGMKTSVIEWYKPLPSWAKGAVIVGGLVLLSYTGFQIVGSINAAKKKREAEAKINGYIDDLNVLTQSGKGPSFSQSQYSQWADALAEQFSACDPTFPGPGCGIIGFSDTGKAVKNVINNFSNDADFLALQAAFGTRTIDKYFICGGDIKNTTLSGAIANMLTPGEISCLNGVFQDKQIKYRF